MEQVSFEKCRVNLWLNLVGVVQLDPWLSPFKDALCNRYGRAQKWIKTIEETEGGLEKFSKGTEIFGFNVQENGDIVYREWAPNAIRAYLIGDFSISSPLRLLFRSFTHDIQMDGTEMSPQ